MVPRVQNTDLLRLPEGTQAEKNGLDQSECVSRVHNIVQTGNSGPSEFQTEKVEISHPGRGTKHQKFQVTTVAAAVKLSNGTTAAADRNTSPEQSDGALVADALPDAACVPIPSGVQGMVLESDDGDD